MGCCPEPVPGLTEFGYGRSVNSHPFITIRERDGRSEAFVIGTGTPVAELVAAVQATGSVSAAAEVLSVNPALIQAAVAYSDEKAATADAIADALPKPPGGGARKTPLELAAQVAGLFTAVAAVIYIAGGVVLTTRLYFARVNPDAVIGQLPRELLLTIGVGQVLLPILVLAGMYAGYRVMRGDAARVPGTRRWAHQIKKKANRLRFVSASLVLACAIVAPGAAYVVLRRNAPERELWWLGVAFLVAWFTALVAIEMRARVAARASAQAAKARAAWSSAQSIAQMSIVWGGLLVPAAIIFWPASVQLQEAKVCTTSGFEESGDLIGQTSDGVYLAENRFRREPRRVATFTAAQTEEVFIGDAAADARCDPSGLRAAALASRGAANARLALSRAKQPFRQLVALAPDANKGAAELMGVAQHAGRVSWSAKDVALAADRSTPGVARPIWDAAERLDRVVREAEAPFYARPDSSGVRPAFSRTLRRTAEAMLREARAAARAATRGEAAIVEHVRASRE